jgi:hypothetical protein
MAIQGLFTHEAPLDIASYLLVDQISRIPHANSTLNGKISMLLCEHNPIDNSVTGDTIAVQGSRV